LAGGGDGGFVDGGHLPYLFQPIHNARAETNAAAPVTRSTPTACGSQVLVRERRTGGFSGTRGRSPVRVGAGAGAENWGSTVTVETPSGAASARSAGSASLIQAWSAPSVAVRRSSEVNPTAVRSPRGVRKSLAAQPDEPGRTGTNSGPAGNRSEGSGSSPHRMSAMGCLLEDPM